MPDTQFANVRIVPAYVREWKDRKPKNIPGGDPADGSKAEGSTGGFTIRRNPEVHRVRRNDLCPCGSGKKFKLCCVRRERMKIAEALLARHQTPATPPETAATC